MEHEHTQLGPPASPDTGIAPTVPLGEEELVRARSSVARPEAIGRYRVSGVLGRGGMGVVYEAHDPSLDRPVAIKLVTPSRSNPDARARLAREARTLAQLSHPNVIEVYEIGEHEGQLFIAMERVQGRDLRRWCAEAEPGMRRIVEAFVDAGRGLAAAHAAGLVHRDFKPDNVMVGDDERVRVLDFGLARAMRGEVTSLDARDGASEVTMDDRLTQTGLAMGTPAYMAPEQFRRVVDDGAADQFAFAVSLFEMIVGRRPFSADSFEGLARATARGELVEPPEHELPRSLLGVIRRALSPAPEDRFSDMDELLEALSAWLAPPRKGRRWVVAGALAATTIVAIGARAWWPDAPSKCVAADAMQDEIWSEERRGAVREAILGTGVAYAEATWATVSPRLDDYAGAWADARRDVCGVLRLEPAADVDDRVACLEHRRMSLQAAVDVLLSAEPSMVHNIERTVVRLPPIGTCDEPGSAGLADGSEAPQYAEARGHIAAAKASYDIGHYETGLRRLQQAEAALGLDPPPGLTGVTALLRGRLEQTQGRALASAEAFEVAYFSALESGRLDLACRAASLVAAEPAVPYRERWQWAGHARAALDRHGEATELVIALERAMCALQRDSGRLEEAIGRCERVLELVESGSSPDPETRVRALSDLGAVLGVAEQRERAYEMLRAALELGETVWGPRHPAVARAANELGHAALARGRHDEARALAGRALDIRRATLGPEHPDVLLAEDLLVELAHGESRYEDARDLAMRGLERRRELFGDAHPLVARSLYALALAEEKLGNHEPALRAMREVSEIEAQLHPLNIDRIPTLREQARMAFEIGGGPTEGRGYLEEAWSIVERSEIPDDHPLVRDLNHGYGETLLELGEADQALPYLERFVDDPRPSVILPHVSFVLARALVRTGRDRERAVRLVREGIETWEGSESEFHRSQVADMRTWLREHGEAPEG